MARILLLGGTSWLGADIASAALARGHDVTCLARGESGSVPAGAHHAVADRDAPDAYDAVREQRWDAVIDVARQPGQVRSAVAALAATAARWTFISTGSVYADQSLPLTEGSPLLPPAHGDVVEPEQYGEGKVACEAWVRELPHHLILRAGLIGGPGDRSDRFGYWVARFASAGDGPVLVPDVPRQPTQTIDARDLAAWAVDATLDDATGVLHAAGEEVAFQTVIEAAAVVAGHSGAQVWAAPEQLVDLGVDYWMGPRSLPLWLPPSHVGMGQMDDSAALRAGLQRCSIEDMTVDVLAYERALGLDRERKAGLTRADELELVAAVQS